MDRVVDHFPNDSFLGEESSISVVDSQVQSGIWVVDPIDGTQPYINNIPSWCISIAFVKRGIIQAGVIFDAVHDELYTALAGHGAYLNGTAIQATSLKDVGDGLVGVGVSLRGSQEKTLRFLANLLRADGIFYRGGSAALSLAYVASGRLLGYYESHLFVWDVLAGILIVKEAGGLTNQWQLSQDTLKTGQMMIASGSDLFTKINTFL